MGKIGLIIAMLAALQNVADVVPGEHGPAPDPEVIATRNDGYNRMTVPVTIGEHGSFRFLVDTGSQRTALSTELASQMALSPIETRRIVGIAGSETAQTTTLGTLGLGRRTFSDLEVLLFAARDIGADGILGIDSLQQ